jgi:hypothetical protein
MSICFVNVKISISSIKGITTTTLAHSSVRLLRQQLADQLDPLLARRIASTAKENKCIFE